VKLGLPTVMRGQPKPPVAVLSPRLSQFATGTVAGPDAARHCLSNAPVLIHAPDTITPQDRRQTSQELAHLFYMQFSRAISSRSKRRAGPNAGVSSFPLNTINVRQSVKGGQASPVRAQRVNT
jgi:hypothetical protein